MRLTPGQAIRKNCIDCVGGALEVKDCQGDKLYLKPCPFYKYRMGKGRPSVKLIRKNCLECMGNSSKMVKNCHTKGCYFYEFRFGTNPKIERTFRGLQTARPTAK